MRKRTFGWWLQWRIRTAKFRLYELIGEIITPCFALILFGQSNRIYRYQRLAPAVRWLYSKLIYDKEVFQDPGDPTWLWAQK